MGIYILFSKKNIYLIMDYVYRFYDVQTNPIYLSILLINAKVI